MRGKKNQLFDLAVLSHIDANHTPHPLPAKHLKYPELTSKPPKPTYNRCQQYLWDVNWGQISVFISILSVNI